MDFKNVSVLHPFAMAIGSNQVLFYECLEKAAYTSLAEKNLLEVFSHSTDKPHSKPHQVAA